MSIQCSINHNGKKYAVGEGNFWIYDHQGNELNRYLFNQFSTGEGRNAETGELLDFTILLSDGEIIKFEDNPKLNEFVETLKKEQAKSL